MAARFPTAAVTGRARVAKEWWQVTSLKKEVNERVQADDANEATRIVEERLRREGRSVPPSIELTAAREKPVTGADYGRT